MCDINHVISQLKLFKRSSSETDRLIRNVVKNGNLENVRKIAELGDFVKHNALFFASSEGNIACLNMLIEMGADVNGTVIEFNDDIDDSHEENDNDDRGSGDKNGANKNGDDDDDDDEEDDDEEEEEKEDGSDHDDECWEEEEDADDCIVGDSLLMFTLKNSKQQLKIAQILIEAGADVNVSNQHGETALMESAFTGNTECLDLLINSGADVNKADKRDNTPLLSVVQGHYNCLELLLQREAHVNNDDNSHALLAACREGQYRCVDALLTAGANVNSTWRGGKTALMEADRVELQADGPDECEPSEPSRVMDKGKCSYLLLASGADVNTRCDAGSTALMYAADNGQEHLTDILIKAGADVNAVDKENETALTKAEKNGHKECVNLLLGAGADVNMIGPNRRTATISAEHQVHNVNVCKHWRMQKLM